MKFTITDIKNVPEKQKINLVLRAFLEGRGGGAKKSYPIIPDHNHLADKQDWEEDGLSFHARPEP